MGKRIKIGDVVQINLPNDFYAYGCVYNDASIGIYTSVTTEPHSPPIGSESFRFIVGVYRDVLTSGQWPVVGKHKFTNPDEEWPPPCFIKDMISGQYRIYYKGEMSPSTEEECLELEEAAVWDAHHIINRIMQELIDEGVDLAKAKGEMM